MSNDPNAPDNTPSDTAVAPHVSLANKIEAVLKKYEHDMIGKVHFVYDEIKAELAKIKAAV